MLTGTWPSGHGVPRNGWPVPETVETVPEILQRAGFATAAFVSSAALDPVFGLNQGFDVYDFSATQEVARDQAWRTAGETLERATSWWWSAPRGKFLWVHLFEPHFPYEPDPKIFAPYDTGYSGEAQGTMDFLFALWENKSLVTPGARAHLEALYHAEITTLDLALGEFLGMLAEDPGTFVIVAADHGESMGEHGLEFKHGPHVFPADVQVPLAVRGASLSPGVTAAMVRTIDCAPTILEALGVKEPHPQEAVSLTISARGGSELPVFAEASMPWDVERPGVYANALKQRALRTSDWALVVTPWKNEQVWFDRREDPAELAPAGPPEEVGRRLADTLEEWAEARRVRTDPFSVDPEMIRRLESLGYTTR
jgi:arylsulfatase A-like enzyme